MNFLRYFLNTLRPLSAALILSLFVATLFLLPHTALAAWSGSPYTPGQTLDPECSPTDSNCTVYAPLTQNAAGTYAIGTAVSGAALSVSSTSPYFIWAGTTTPAFVATLGGRVGIGTSSPYTALGVAGQITASNFVGTTTTASTFGGPIGIGTTTPNALDALSITNTTVGSNDPHGGLPGIGIANTSFGSADWSLHPALIPYGNESGNTYYDTYMSSCYTGKNGSNAGMLGISGCKITEFPWYSAADGRWGMEDYIRIDNSSTTPAITNYRPYFFRYDLQPAQSFFEFSSVKQFIVDDYVKSSNTDGPSWNADGNVLYLDAQNQRGQSNLHNFSIGNQTNIASTKFAVIASSTETDLSYIFQVASTSAGGVVTTLLSASGNGGLKFANVVPAVKTDILYNNSGALSWNGTVAAPTFSGTTFSAALDSANKLVLHDGSGNADLYTNNVSRMRWGVTGNVGVATATPVANFAVNPIAGTASNRFVVGSSTGTSLIVNNSGFVGVGTTSPWRTLSLAGTLAASGLTTAAGTPSSICMNATTNEVTVNAALSCTVSARDQKQGIMPLDVSGIDTVMRLKPTIFEYRDYPDRVRWGFVADELQDVNPSLADGYNTPGFDPTKARSIDEPALIAALTKAFQEQQLQLQDLVSPTSTLLMSRSDEDPSIHTFAQRFFDRLASWVGQAGNGILDFFARRVHTEEICVGAPGNETCLKKDDLDRLLGRSSAPVVIPGPVSLPLPVVEPAPADSAPASEAEIPAAETTLPAPASATPPSPPGEKVPAPAQG